MRVEVAQGISVPRERVVEALVDPAWYATIETRASLGAPEPLLLQVLDGVVHTAVRWRYAGTLPAAASRVLDASRLTWVIEVRLALDSFSGTVHVVPDHYEGLLTCEATIELTDDDGATLERVAGDLQVRVPLFADAVERAIAGAFEDHLRTEAEALERYCG